eukprot:CAMPEP_0173357780 /NCGR_PEP_ID=MMETSP1144-20121109/19102_1 /TAXON_ID=483371 /ORGANISM="non described non described, Strain CCMP2298" /LENGTH=176 /DNA_ID=CAMNT_0014306821 /DNA_START=240 /DNA_END=766 /DNA_ORIENTATION=-
MIGLSISPKAGSPKSRASDRVQREREEQAGPMSTAKKIILLTTGYLIIILIAVVGGNPAIQAPKGIASRRRAGWMFIHTALEVDNYLRAAEGAGMAGVISSNDLVVLRGEGVVQGHISSVFGAMQDMQWVHRLKSSEPLPEKGSDVLRVRFSLPWPFSDRDFELTRDVKLLPGRRA